MCDTHQLKALASINAKAIKYTTFINYLMVNQGENAKCAIALYQGDTFRCCDYSKLTFLKLDENLKLVQVKVYFYIIQRNARNIISQSLSTTLNIDLSVNVKMDEKPKITK